MTTRLGSIESTSSTIFRVYPRKKQSVAKPSLVRLKFMEIIREDLESASARRKIINQLSLALSQGLLIIAPIAQGYAYICDGRSNFAVGRVREIKGYDSSVPLVNLVYGPKQIEQYCDSLTSEQIKLLQKFALGPLVIERESQAQLRFSFGSRLLPDKLLFAQASNPIMKSLCRKVGPLAFSPLMTNSGEERHILTDLTTLPEESAQNASFFLHVNQDSWSKAKSTLIAMRGVEVVIRKIGDITESSIREIVPRAKVEL
ncbi:MAG: hypothetical protein EB009_01220 [Actinobacteria bacterium]|nr:hypothetical protein [Actinomycetota bacterium]NBO47161.1 hypothetical protein [Actinomycetota bacterium]NBP21993.1 hypothetical protein [Actinomycetota bacterium]NBP42706.1 hypothetical protein [Actinomycetota bacterium]NCY10590.1 hypothetical protein [Actinomycetota bacterium]